MWRVFLSVFLVFYIPFSYANWSGITFTPADHEKLSAIYGSIKIPENCVCDRDSGHDFHVTLKASLMQGVKAPKTDREYNDQKKRFCDILKKLPQSVSIKGVSANYGAADRQWVTFEVQENKKLAPYMKKPHISLYRCTGEQKNRCATALMKKVKAYLDANPNRASLAIEDVQATWGSHGGITVNEVACNSVLRADKKIPIQRKII